MKLPELGLHERKTLVVLGAGATRGSSFAEQSAVPPPLDRDFFQILQMSSTGRSAAGRKLLEHVRRFYGPALDVGMETVFNNLDAAATFHQELNVGPGAVPQWPVRLIDAFRTVLPGLLGETIGNEACRYHDELAARLRATDAAVTLNYDCVMDRSLCAQAGNRFSAERLGYGVPIAAGAEHWHGTAPGPSPNNSVRLLKLHGSLNWATAHGQVELRTDAEIYEPVAEGVVQPPLTKKPVTEEPFRTIWRAARNAVKGMRRLVIIGYSMPAADGLVRTLLGTDLSNLEDLIVIEKNPNVQAAHVDFFNRRADPARVFQFATLGQFIEVLDS